MLVEKEVIRPGVYWYRDETTGRPRKLVVTPELIRYWHEQGNKMLGLGLTVPVPKEHDFNAHPMTPAEKLESNAGWVKDYRIKEIDGKDGKKIKDVLFSAVDIQDEDFAKKLPRTVRWTSPWINSFTDGSGREWKNVISHLALTTRPRIIDQQPFDSVAAAMSVATITGINKIESDSLPERGICLTRAGLLDGDLPAYPLAFSMWSGVALANAKLVMDRGTASKTNPKGRRAKPGVRGAQKLSEFAATKSNSTKGNEAAAQYALNASNSAKAGDSLGAHLSHQQAALTHVDRARELHAAGKHDEAGAEAEAAGAHFRAAHAHLQRHNSGKLGAQFAQGDATSAVPNDDDSDDDVMPTSDDAAPDNSMDVSGLMDPTEDSQGDVKMEELLCDLLQALGVPMPDESNPAEFKRHLYEAAMSKIKELTSKGMGKDAADTANNQAPDQNKPPSQQPNASQPQNPLMPQVQQEQQPMFMSLEAIDALPEEMRGVVRAMYDENKKILDELAEDKKVALSLRAIKLQDETAARNSRISILTKLLPNVRADLEAMAASPAMALSITDGGIVVDPMTKMLATLERSVSDSSQLMMDEAVAMSVKPTTSLTTDQANEMADGFARLMGCTR